MSNITTQSESSLSFTQGFILGQISIVLLLSLFIKYFIFGPLPSADYTASLRATDRRSRTLAHKRSLLLHQPTPTLPQPSRTLRTKRSSILRSTPSLTTTDICRKTYYNVHSHVPESLDWFNVLIAQTLAQLRADAQYDDAILSSLSSALNGGSRPDFLDEIKVTELTLGEEFPIFSNCRVCEVGEDGGVVTGGRGKGDGEGGAAGGRLQARMDVDLSDFITLGLSTTLVLNYPRPRSALLPIALSVSITRFSGTLSISFLASPPASQTSQTTAGAENKSGSTMAFSFLDDYRMDLEVRSLVGSKSRLQDVPKIAQLVEQRLHAWLDERCVEPRVQIIGVPSLWPRKRNTRGGEGEVGDEVKGEAEREVEREKERQREAERLRERERVEQEGLKWRRRARGEEYEFDMPGGMPNS